MSTSDTPMQETIRQLLAQLGEDTSREGLLDTPKRIEQSLKFLTSGYQANVDEIVNNALFTVDYNEMVIVKDIDFYSLCEHHLLPFFGKCHVAYIPNGKVIGLSKIPRIVEIFARRLQVQERLTNQIAETINQKIKPLGVAVVTEAAHLCMSMRGVEKQNSVALAERDARRLPQRRPHPVRVPRPDPVQALVVRSAALQGCRGGGHPSPTALMRRRQAGAPAPRPTRGKPILRRVTSRGRLRLG